MKNILEAPHHEALRCLSKGKALLAFDFDGTLAPIVASRDLAYMNVLTQRLFDSVCHLYPCAVVSGRSRADVLGRLGGAGVKHVVGNHGIELSDSDSSVAPGIAPLYEHLRLKLAGLKGVEVEDKTHSLSIHYRQAPNESQAQQSILAALQSTSFSYSLVGGKFVLNVVPQGARHKGNAVQVLKEIEGADHVLYVGDDDTDEDVFCLKEPAWLLTIRIGASSKSAAEYFLPQQSDINRMLAKLVLLQLEISGRTL